MNIKPPFKVDKLVYRNGLLVMYNGDYSQVCVAKVYAKEENSSQASPNEISFKMKIDSVISITGRGVVCSGRIESGNIKVGDFIDVEYLSGITVAKSFKVLGIEQFRKYLDTAQKGDYVGILLNTTSTEKIRENMVIVKRG